jgi:hypothetical protein
VLLTGKTNGIPPLTGLLPSRIALSLTHKFSVPSTFFQLVTVAPKSRTSTVSPVGRRAETVLVSSEMLTTGCGAAAVWARFFGLLARSTIVTVDLQLQEVGLLSEAGEFRSMALFESNDCFLLRMRCY